MAKFTLACDQCDAGKSEDEVDMRARSYCINNHLIAICMVFQTEIAFTQPVEGQITPENGVRDL